MGLNDGLDLRLPAQHCTDRKDPRARTGECVVYPSRARCSIHCRLNSRMWACACMRVLCGTESSHVGSEPSAVSPNSST